MEICCSIYFFYIFFCPLQLWCGAMSVHRLPHQRYWLLTDFNCISVYIQQGTKSRIILNLKFCNSDAGSCKFTCCPISVCWHQIFSTPAKSADTNYKTNIWRKLIFIPYHGQKIYCNLFEYFNVRKCGMCVMSFDSLGDQDQLM